MRLAALLLLVLAACGGPEKPASVCPGVGSLSCSAVCVGASSVTETPFGDGGIQCGCACPPERRLTSAEAVSFPLSSPSVDENCELWLGVCR